jgi:uncharacterized protein YuzE
MKEFKFDYDSENDDLFVYSEGLKSSGAVEFGNLILDFDDKSNLVAFQIINASEFFSKFFSKILDLSKMSSLNAEVINFRNMDALKLKVSFGDFEESSNILIPRIKQSSPALSC